MKIICAIIVIAVATIFAGQSMGDKLKNNQNNQAKQELKQRGEQWFQAIVHGDAVALNDILSDEVTITNAFGKVHNKAQEMMLRKAFVHNVSSNNAIDDVRFYGNAAVVTGLYTMRVQPPQKQIYWVEYRYTSMWSKRGEKWRIVAQQFTRVAND